MKKYVVGFIFNEDRKEILLITKLRPSWQNGRLNGVGGHVEPEESFLEAMIREAKEECGLDNVVNWKLFAKGTEINSKDEIAFFKCFTEIDDLTETGDEQVDTYPVTVATTMQVIPNLRWLIPLALDDQNSITNFEFVLNPNAQ